MFCRVLCKCLPIVVSHHDFIINQLKGDFIEVTMAFWVSVNWLVIVVADSTDAIEVTMPDIPTSLDGRSPTSLTEQAEAIADECLQYACVRCSTVPLEELVVQLEYFPDQESSANIIIIVDWSSG